MRVRACTLTALIHFRTSMLPDILFLIIGLALLYFGGEWLVRGSGSLAARLSLSPLFIGLTIVAFGTSAPELVVSLQSTLAGAPAIALGNVLGSNICNIGLILGLSAMIFPIAVHKQLIRVEIPIMLGVTALLLFFVMDGALSQFEGITFIVLLLAYVVVGYFLAKKAAVEAEDAIEVTKSVWLDIALVGVGLALLIGGGKLLVIGAVNIARTAGLGEAVIGLTIVAFGTSLPELSTSIIAALKKRADIAVGNIVGSNILNILCILGVCSIIKPFEVAGFNWMDFAMMSLMAVVLLPLAFTGYKITRMEGGILGLAYIGYTILLFISV